MFIVGECAASQRTRCIIARQRLRANDLGARMEMISRHDLARAEAPSTYGHDDGIKVASAQYFLAKRGVASDHTIIVVGLRTKCPRLFAQQLLHTFVATDLPDIDEVNNASIRLHGVDLHLGRS